MRGLAASTRTDAHLMAAVIVAVGTVMILWSNLGGELIPVRDGTGYDGSVYAGIARNPHGWLVEDSGHLGAHRFQRILPSLVVHAFLRPFSMYAETPAVIFGFHILNFALMATGCYLWRSIALRLDLTRATVWLGFIALFVNYAMLKFASYYPVLTDVAGFFLGLLLLWCLVHGRYRVMPWVGLAGAFTWPTVFYSALLLFALSNPTGQASVSRRRGRYAAGALAMAAPVSALLVYRCGRDCVAPVMMGTTIEPLLPLSLAVLAVFVFAATRPLLDRLDPRQLVAAVHWRRLAVSVCLLTAVMVAVSLVAEPTEQTVGRTLRNVSLGGAVKPGGFLVAHTIYFGPGVILAGLLWRRIAPGVGGYGPGLVLLMVGYVLLATDVESRKFMNLWPFFAAFTAYAAHRVSWDQTKVAGFAVLAAVVSRVWLPIHHGELTGNHRAYPDQFYFMSMGPRMTVLSYAIMLAVTMLTAVAVWWLTRRQRMSARR